MFHRRQSSRHFLSLPYFDASRHTDAHTVFTQFPLFDWLILSLTIVIIATHCSIMFLLTSSTGFIFDSKCLCLLNIETSFEGFSCAVIELHTLCFLSQLNKDRVQIDPHNELSLFKTLQNAFFKKEILFNSNYLFQGYSLAFLTRIMRSKTILEILKLCWPDVYSYLNCYLKSNPPSTIELITRRLSQFAQIMSCFLSHILYFD